jgi:glycolate oxidase iron-sulfur subunit
MTQPAIARTAPPDCAIPGTPLAGQRAGLDACVHCGFCLQACPTYVTLEDENDSPRGRIVLMRALYDGTLDTSSESLQTHIDRCLGCRACETVCPSGVPYGFLLEATRETIAEHRRLPRIARVILSTFERPRLLGLAMFGGRVLRVTGVARLLSRLPGRIGFSMAMLSSTSRRFPRRQRARAAVNGPAGAGGRVAPLDGCVMEGLFAETNRATERVLSANGYIVADAPGQGCCGALHAHAGDADGARRLARRNIAAFERAAVDFVCVNAAGCGAAMKEYAQLLADDPEWRERADRFAAKVRDISELVAVAGPHPGGAVRMKVAYDAPCHLLHAQRVSNPPLIVLRAIPGLQLVPLTESEMCCGSAGIYNLVEPETSDLVLQRKLKNIEAAGAEVVATGNPGCMMQIGAGLLRTGSKVGVVHPVDLLDESYAAAPDESRTTR